MKKVLCLIFFVFILSSVFAGKVAEGIIGDYKTCLEECMNDPRCVGSLIGSCKLYCDNYCISGEEPIIDKYHEFKIIEPTIEELEIEKTKFEEEKLEHISLDPSFTLFLVFVMFLFGAYLVYSIIRK